MTPPQPQPVRCDQSCEFFKGQIPGTRLYGCTSPYNLSGTITPAERRKLNGLCYVLHSSAAGDAVLDEVYQRLEKMTHDAEMVIENPLLYYPVVMWADIDCLFAELREQHKQER
jgi:hypothetical protein